MLFNSYLFILFFLPLCLLGWFLLNRLESPAPARLFLIGMSLWFYGYFNPAYLPILCGSVLGNYLLSRAILRAEGGKRKWLTVLGVAANVAVIFYFKYFDFFLSNCNALFGTSFTLRHILLPLGISFFTFQQISYLVDSGRGETADHGFVEYALFVCFFPQLVAGPIVLHGEMIGQFRDPARRRFSCENAAHGLYLFAVGLGKKVLVADLFGRAVSWGFSDAAGLSWAEAALVSLAYTFQLYFDFSGYCDMARGIARMFNLELPVNFDSPYQALSVTDFWARWHLTLTRFLRRYVYIPLGGNRRGRARTYGNILAVYLLSGLWHGANWTFVLWGLLHGLASCLDRAVRPAWDRLWKPLRLLATFLFVDLAWVLFRADSVSQGLLLIGRIFTGAPQPGAALIRPALADCFSLYTPSELAALSGLLPGLLGAAVRAFGPACMLLLYALAILIVLCGRNLNRAQPRFDGGRLAATAALLVCSVLSLSGVSVFLYFNF